MLCALNPADLIPREHPIRAIKKVVDTALAEIDPQLTAMYASGGRPSIPPERLLKAMLLMALFSVRSDRQLCEQIRYNLMFRWFLDMTMTEAVWDRTVFSHNRDRLIEHRVARELFGAVVAQARAQRLMSEEHFSVDGTLIEAWASMKSFRPKDESEDDNEPPSGGSKSNRWSDFRGTKRSNATHASTTDPESKLMRKGLGKEAKLSFSGHVLMENRNGLVVDIRVAEANGKAERAVALDMLSELSPGRRTVGADRGYDPRDFVEGCRALGVTPHVAQFTKGRGRRGSAIDARTTRHSGYKASQRIRKRVEETFGWMKQFGGLRRTRFRGLARTDLLAVLSATALNALRIARMTIPLAAV